MAKYKLEAGTIITRYAHPTMGGWDAFELENEFITDQDPTAIKDDGTGHLCYYWPGQGSGDLYHWHEWKVESYFVLEWNSNTAQWLRWRWPTRQQLK